MFTMNPKRIINHIYSYFLNDLHIFEGIMFEGIFEVVIWEGAIFEGFIFERVIFEGIISGRISFGVVFGGARTKVCRCRMYGHNQGMHNVFVTSTALDLLARPTKVAACCFYRLLAM